MHQAFKVTYKKHRNEINILLNEHNKYIRKENTLKQNIPKQNMVKQFMHSNYANGENISICCYCIQSTTITFLTLKSPSYL